MQNTEVKSILVYLQVSAVIGIKSNGIGYPVNRNSSPFSHSLMKAFLSRIYLDSGFQGIVYEPNIPFRVQRLKFIYLFLHLCKFEFNYVCLYLHLVPALSRSHHLTHSLTTLVLAFIYSLVSFYYGQNAPNTLRLFHLLVQTFE